MKKKNLLMLALSLCLVAVIVVGGTLAYFTDTTESALNTFTMGEVGIALTETTTDTSDASSNTNNGIDYVNVQPGDTRSKIVKVSKLSDTLDCYAAVLVKAVPDTNSGKPATNDLLELVKAEVNNEWTLVCLDKDRHVVVLDDNGDIPATAVFLLCVHNDPLTDENSEATLFTEISFPGEEWGNEYKNALFKLDISAYAVQSNNIPAEMTGNIATWFASNLDAIEADN